MPGGGPAIPSDEYYCEACEAIFEELRLSRDEVRAHAKSHPCKFCGQESGRVPSASNFTFKGVAEGDPTRAGNSGVHDLDYPTLDKAVGRSANRKWKEYGARKAARDEARRRFGTNAISVGADGSPAPVDPKVLDARDKGLRLLKKAKESGSG